MIAVSVPPEMPVRDLRDRYFRYCLTVRGLTEGVVKKRRIYLDRLTEFAGPSSSSTELFDKLDRNAITAFVVDYSSRYGIESRRQMHSITRSFLRFAYEERFMSEDFSGIVPSVRSPRANRLARALPLECMLALDESVKGDCPLGRRDSAIIGMLCTYGARGVQLRRLRLEHIDWQRQQIHLPCCKAGWPVDQFLTDEVGERLFEYITDGRPPSAHREVFLDHSTAAPIAESRDLSRIIDRCLKQANISVPEGVSRGTHGFRHAFGARMVGKVPLKDLADMLGHRDLSNTLLYTKTDTKTLQLAALPWPGVSS